MSEQRVDLLSPEEVERWADTFTAELCDPKSPIRKALLRGLDEPDLARAFAPKILPGSQILLDPIVASAWRQLIVSGDRDRIRETLKRMLRESPRSYVEWLQKVTDKVQLRKALLAHAEQFKGKQGRGPKLEPDQYKLLVDRADSLYPVLLYVLQEQKRGTRHNMPELLDFLFTDYPKPVTYLLRHIDKLEEALRDPKYLKNAKKIETRARLLADGLAGCEENYAFSSSVERVRQGRRSR